MALDPDKSLLGRVTQSIPEFLSIAHAIDNDFHLRPSLLPRADAHSNYYLGLTRIQAVKEALCPPTRPRFRCARTQLLRQRQRPSVQARKTLRPEFSSILSASAGGRNSQPPRDRRRPGAAGCFHSAASPHHWR